MKYPLSPAALAQHVAFLGKTGAGKTVSAKGAVEHILRENPGARVCVLDPIKSDWWGLTSSADGRRPGFPFQILGGPHGHVPLHPSAGKAVGELVGRGDLPLSIIDMADFPMGGLQTFFNEFAPALMRSMRGVVHLVLEEAHEFAPKERSGVGNENMAVYHAKKLATAGRSKGIRLVLVTQRTQSLHNALLGSCDTMVAHRLTAPADQAPVKEWLKAHFDKATLEKVGNSLASLRTGTAWVCSGESVAGAEVATFPPLTTFDNSATPTGQDGQRHVTTAPVDRDKLAAIMGDAVAEAAANDPKTLKARIKELEAEVARKPAPTVDQDAIERARAQGYREGYEFGADEKRRQFEERIDRYREAHINAMSDLVSPMPLLPPPAIVATAARQAREATAPPPRQPSRAPADGSLAKGPRALLTAVAQLSRRYGPRVFTPARIGIIAGYSPGSSTFREYMRQLVAAGLVARSGEGFQIHPDGERAAGDVAPLPSGAALVDYWVGQVGRGQGAILRAVADARGAMPADAIAGRAGFSLTSSTWREYARQLRALRLIEGRDTIQLGEALR